MNSKKKPNWPKQHPGNWLLSRQARRTQALLAIAQALLDKEDLILHNNEKDYKEAEASGMGAAMLDRLMLNSKRLKGISDDVKVVAALPDPVGEIIEERTLPNGLLLSKRRVPLGVIGAIYESRPNVTVDISVLCLKSGNASILRGGKESSRSNLALAEVVQEAAYKAGIPRGFGAVHRIARPRAWSTICSR